MGAENCDCWTEVWFARVKETLGVRQKCLHHRGQGWAAVMTEGGGTVVLGYKLLTRTSTTGPGGLCDPWVALPAFLCFFVHQKRHNSGGKHTGFGGVFLLRIFITLRFKTYM